MKVGIITFHNANNYGAVLQAYALSAWLKENGADAEIIDYRSRVFDKYRLFRTQFYRRKPYYLLIDLFKYPEKKRRNRNFDRFRDYYLPVSGKQYAKCEELEGLADEYDFFICGSDQIWNPELTKGIDPAYYLAFVKDPNKKIAYAPSVALKKLNAFQIKKIEDYIVPYKALSIREQEAIDILQPFCGQVIEKTCDPVFLPDIGTFDRVCAGAHDDRKYLFLYIVGSASNYKDVISYAENQAEKRGLETIYLIDGDRTFSRIKGKSVFGCKPEEFLSYIRNAEMVISNSFHATAFSILFKKQFAAFIKAGTGSRVVNLLKEFGLQDRVLDFENNSNCFDKTIDYSDLDQRLETFRKNSREFLLDALDLNRKQGGNDAAEESVKRRKAKKELDDFTAWRRDCRIARHKDRDVLANSRSGGVFTALSDAVLSKGGVVYGCVMIDPYTAVHKRAATAAERDALRGSKYIQSDMRGCYQQVKADLRNGIPVLFSGTGCQVAGLYGFLKGEDTELLYTTDIICHGVPSPSLWAAYLDWIKEKYGKDISEVCFRDKSYGWKAHYETIRMEDSVRTASTYKRLFLKNAFLRPSCYECPFSSLKRKSDITIGDAWGIESTRSKLNDDKGCSIVLINSEKGKSLFDGCRNDLIVEAADLEDFLQPNIYQPSVRPQNRQQYWDCLEQQGFDKLAEKYARPNIVRVIKDRAIISAHDIREHGREKAGRAEKTGK